MKYTPELITELGENQVFVFGSNLAGKHNGGGAKVALEKFGAIYGKSIGIQGQSYAIPTLGYSFERLPLEEIGLYIKDFINYSESNPSKEFLVTKIGCGIAGYDLSKIAPFFSKINKNVLIPYEFDYFNTTRFKSEILLK